MKEITLQEAQKVIADFPEEEHFVQENYANGLGGDGEYWDNTLDTSEYWQRCKKIVDQSSHPSGKAAEEKGGKPLYPFSESGLENMLWDYLHDLLKNQGYSTGSEESYDKLTDELKRRQTLALEILQGDKQGEDGWVSVKDKLPPNNELVNDTVIYWDNKVKFIKIGCYDYESDDWTDWGHGRSISKFEDVTHWRPLPSPPKQ